MLASWSIGSQFKFRHGMAFLIINNSQLINYAFGYVGIIRGKKWKEQKVTSKNKLNHREKLKIFPTLNLRNKKLVLDIEMNIH